MRRSCVEKENKENRPCTRRKEEYLHMRSSFYNSSAGGLSPFEPSRFAGVLIPDRILDTRDVDKTNCKRKLRKDLPNP